MADTKVGLESVGEKEEISQLFSTNKQSQIFGREAKAVAILHRCFSNIGYFCIDVYQVLHNKMYHVKKAMSILSFCYKVMNKNIK